MSRCQLFFGVAELHGVQTRIQAVLRHQLGVCAQLHNAPLLRHRDAMCHLDSAEPMGNDAGLVFCGDAHTRVEDAKLGIL